MAETEPKGLTAHYFFTFGCATGFLSSIDKL